jgi:hypothetical protein
LSFTGSSATGCGSRDGFQFEVTTVSDLAVEAHRIPSILVIGIRALDMIVSNLGLVEHLVKRGFSRFLFALSKQL